MAAIANAARTCEERGLLSERRMLAALACGVASFSTAPAGLHRGRARPRIAAPHCSAADLDVDQVVRQTKPVTLAYLGDAVWELEVRKRLLWPPRKINALNSAVVTKTCAEGQHVRVCMPVCFCASWCDVTDWCCCCPTLAGYSHPDGCRLRAN